MESIQLEYLNLIAAYTSPRPIRKKKSWVARCRFARSRNSCALPVKTRQAEPGCSAVASFDLETVAHSLSSPEETSQAVSTAVALLDHGTVTSSLPGPEDSETSHANGISAVLLDVKTDASSLPNPEETCRAADIVIASFDPEIVMLLLLCPKDMNPAADTAAVLFRVEPRTVTFPSPSPEETSRADDIAVTLCDLKIVAPPLQSLEETSRTAVTIVTLLDLKIMTSPLPSPEETSWVAYTGVGNAR